MGVPVIDDALARRNFLFVVPRVRRSMALRLADGCVCEGWRGKRASAKAKAVMWCPVPPRPYKSPAFRAEGEGGSIDDRDHANVDRHTELAAYNAACCGTATGRVDFLPMITLRPR